MNVATNIHKMKPKNLFAQGSLFPAGPTNPETHVVKPVHARFSSLVSFISVSVCVFKLVCIACVQQASSSNHNVLPIHAIHGSPPPERMLHGTERPILPRHLHIAVRPFVIFAPYSFEHF